MYALIRPLLFHLDPERAHAIALKSLQLSYQLGLTNFLPSAPQSRPTKLFGLTFPNIIGVAAGLDKNAEYIDALATLGFGFIEVGSVTPKPQPGNPRPRLFRLTKQEAIINRMGFNSKGLDYVTEQLEKTRYKGILGINIAKNRTTSNDDAVIDYLAGFRRLWKYASYITINISSPNTPGLRDLQQADYLKQLLSALKNEQTTIAREQKKYVPLVVKISPDMPIDGLNEVATILLEQKIDGVIATNTTLQREGVEQSPYATEVGGLSGKPLQILSTETISQLHSQLQGRIPIIASGGIMDKKSGQEKLNAGASLLQVYTGFIYKGPALIRRLI
jgi:dihydroorotate dehydrogenase